jgi:hypothetical protein
MCYVYRTTRSLSTGETRENASECRRRHLILLPGRVSPDAEAILQAAIKDYAEMLCCVLTLPAACDTSVGAHSMDRNNP